MYLTNAVNFIEVCYRSASSSRCAPVHLITPIRANIDFWYRMKIQNSQFSSLMKKKMNVERQIIEKCHLSSSVTVTMDTNTLYVRFVHNKNMIKSDFLFVSGSSVSTDLLVYIPIREEHRNISL